MRRPLLGLALLGLLGVIAACDTGKAGTGFLDVGDLRDPPVPDHFTGEAVVLEARLALRSNGCVTVVVDGVERMPLWPDGTDVAPKPGDLTHYVVELPGGITLTVDDASGDAFRARGVIDNNPGPFEVDGVPAEKVASFLAFCGVEALPVAFPDAATFTAR